MAMLSRRLYNEIGVLSNILSAIFIIITLRQIPLNFGRNVFCIDRVLFAVI